MRRLSFARRGSNPTWLAEMSAFKTAFIFTFFLNQSFGLWKSHPFVKQGFKSKFNKTEDHSNCGVRGLRRSRSSVVCPEVSRSRNGSREDSSCGSSVESFEGVTFAIVLFFFRLFFFELLFFRLLFFELFFFALIFFVSVFFELLS